ncbi:MAG TPA: L-threonylcarbamoyladenylate synthase, partial [Nitrolancea sp.]|nr:L-threonylcarbamoyladenylate synthase [Nitrolancea sp.]
AEVRSASQPDVIDRAVELLNRGELVVFPTDTVYGIGASVDRPDAVAQLYVAKGRPLDRPIPVLISDFGKVARLARNVDARLERFMRRFWPGGLTVVLEAAAWLPHEIVGDTGHVGLRIPDHPVALALIAASGGAIATTSANRSGEPAATTACEAYDALAERAALVIDAGQSPGGNNSTVIAIDDGRITILRDGAIPASEFPETLPD